MTIIDFSPIKISVAMTTFNGCPYVESQLESMAAQTRLPDEIVIGDDQSTDTTDQVVNAFSRRHPNITVRFERNSERLGTTRNFEHVVRRCSGDVVVFADQDDLWMPNRLARLLETFAANPKAAYVFSNGLLIDEGNQYLNGSLFSSVYFTEEERAQYRNGKAFEVLLRHNFVTGAALAVRSEHLTRTLPFQSGWHHDYYLPFVLELAGGGILLDEPLIQYRCHKAQQVGVAASESVDRVLAYAKKQSEAYCRQDAESFRKLKKRFINMNVPPHHPIITALDEKSLFFDMRADMRSDPRSAPKLLWQAWGKEYYVRYALGWKQVVVDIVASVIAAMSLESRNKS
ncbi:glycosyltransferase [Propionivibrio sp.]|uniref:glycosyltransferase n=1 Tax=Propionivibrio sp. TaxID=2212460 RepID=UPI003BF03B2C